MLIGTVHGAFADCSNDLPGIFVESDDVSVLEFLHQEVYGSVCDVRGIYNGTLPFYGPFGAPEYGEFWTDEDEIFKSGGITSIEVSFVSGQISAIRTRYGNTWSIWHGKESEQRERIDLPSKLLINQVKVIIHKSI